MYLNDYTRHAQSADRSRKRMRARGVTPLGHKIWTEEEDEVCRRHKTNYAAIQKELPHRTRDGIRYRCSMLGLCRKLTLLTARELSLLRKIGPTASKEQLRAAFPNRSIEALKSLRRYYKISRKRRPFEATGYPIIDALRQRCFELNLSMGDLDKMARCKRYFTVAPWHGHPLNYRAIGRAVAALDGELTVRWRDE